MGGTICFFFLNIMSDTTLSCSNLSNSHAFLSDGKQSEMSKRPQERSSSSSPMNARAWCFVSRDSVSVGRNCSSNLEILETTGNSQEWNLGEGSTSSGSCSVQPATGNRVYMQKGLSECEKSTPTRRKCLKNVDGLRDFACTSRYGRYSKMASSMEAALHMLTKRLFSGVPQTLKLHSCSTLVALLGGGWVISTP